MKLCVIPARGGSNRILGKNIREFCGFPIITYSIKAAISSKCFDKIIVSTDDQEIAEVAKLYGAEVPFIRPDEFSNDHATILPVVKHAIEWFEKRGQSPKDVCCLFATAPFVTPNTIKKAYKQLKESQKDYCFSITSAGFPIQRSFKLTQERGIKMLYPEFFDSRSQDLESIYHDAGQFYWGKAEAFKQLKSLFSEAATSYILPRYLVQDIDTEEDWVRSEMMFRVAQEIKILDK